MQYSLFTVQKRNKMKTFSTILFLTLVFAASSSAFDNRPRYLLDEAEREASVIPREAAPSGTDQSLTCYAGDNFFGPSLTMDDYVPDLRAEGWDDEFSSCCFNGIWLLYEDEDFNTDSFQV